jgi:catechol-2,3-dioxygenase
VGASAEDLAAARRHLESHGLAPFGEYARGFCVRDPDGHEIELYVDPDRPAAPASVQRDTVRRSRP